jgi:hypothetical protein
MSRPAYMSQEGDVRSTMTERVETGLTESRFSETDTTGYFLLDFGFFYGEKDI